jgi:hypothetical protein
MKIIMGQQRFIRLLQGGGTPSDGMMKFGTFVDRLDAMNHAKFHLHMMNILLASGRSGGSKKRFSFGNAQGSYNIAFSYHAGK